MDLSTTIWKDWPESIGTILLVIGFVIAISMDSALFVYIVVFLAGLLAGRSYFLRIGKQPLFPFFLIIIGFLVGFTFGASAANRIAVVIIFFIAWIISHIAHKEGIIPK